MLASRAYQNAEDALGSIPVVKGSNPQLTVVNVFVFFVIVLFFFMLIFHLLKLKIRKSSYEKHRKKIFFNFVHHSHFSILYFFLISTSNFFSSGIAVFTAAVAVLCFHSFFIRFLFFEFLFFHFVCSYSQWIRRLQILNVVFFFKILLSSWKRHDFGTMFKGAIISLIAPIVSLLKPFQNIWHLKQPTPLLNVPNLFSSHKKNIQVTNQVEMIF